MVNTAPTRNHHRLRVGVVAVAALVALTGCAGNSSSPAPSATTTSTASATPSTSVTVAPATGSATGSNSYVVLGDSYSAGVGAGGSTGSCYRSPKGYGPLVAAQYDLQLSYQACGGAMISDVLSKQLGTLSASTSRVSLSICGNDVGFGFVLFVCGAPSWLSDCRGTIASGQSTLRTTLPARLQTLFTQIRAKAPRAKVSIVGYPHLFGDRDCNALTFFSGPDRDALDTATDQLDTLLQKTATAYGFGFVDPRPTFEAHTPCTSQPWINGLAFPFGDSYHPDIPGQQAFASLVGPALNPKSAAAPRVTARSSQPSVQTVATAVLAMRLDQPTQLRAAQQGGVDTAQVKTYVQNLRSKDQATMAAGIDGLRGLDRAHTARTGK
ncbi:MAG: SGNH/GDSL hydrolase family protein [Allobranchiibius sp.]